MISMSSEGRQSAADVQPAGVRRGRWLMLGVFSAFLLPLLLAVYLYANLDIWRPATRVNHGELLEPIRPLEFFVAVDAEGQTVPVERLRHKWTLLFVAEGDCRLECQAAMFKLRQAHAMLGRELVRVQYGYLALDQAAAESIGPIKGQHPLMWSARVPGEAVEPQRAAFGGGAVAGYAYLLDPLGNLVLRYGPESTTKGVVKDLQRLLKVSRIG